ncbi:MAG: efflux transporter outer membrane subunit [Rhodospirillales bacterium]|nr:efflux transporter outer membrane subunit [Rhodospirillales bacterium]
MRAFNFNQSSPPRKRGSKATEISIKRLGSRFRGNDGRGRLAVPLCLGLLASCSMVPEYETPLTSTPIAWKTQVASAGELWPSTEWWQEFRSPTLNALVAAAQRNNPDIGVAAARVLQADAQARIAGAPLLPTVDLETSRTRTKSTSSRSTSSSSSRSTITTTYNANLSASYEIDFWGKNRAALAAARATLTGTRYDGDTVALTVVSNVATTYFQILQFRDRLQVARQNLRNAERVLSVVEARVQNGAASPLDLAQQRTVVLNQRAAIPPLEVQVRQAENALAILLGANPADVEAAGVTLADVMPPAVAAGLPSELLLRRPDVQSAEAQLIAASATIGNARAAMFPSIQLTGTYGVTSTALHSLFEPTSIFFSLAGSVAQSIFQGGAQVAQVDFTEARFQELVHTYRKAVISAFADVENALIAAQQTREQESLQADAVEQARLALDLAETRYREGAIDLLGVLDAQRTLYQAEDQLVQVRLARLQASVSLMKALGGGWRV